MDTQKPNEGSGSKLGSDASLNKTSPSGQTGSQINKPSDSLSGQSQQSGKPGSVSGSPSTSSMSGSSTSQSSIGAGSAGSFGSSGGAMSGHEGSSLGTVGATKGQTERLHEGISKAADSAQPIVDRLANTAHTAVDKVQHSLSGVQETVSEKQRQLAESYGHYLDSGRDYVRMKPATAIAGAFVAGFILAKIFGGRRD